jgi:serine/threonine protein phosphatase PrpC
MLAKSKICAGSKRANLLSFELAQLSLVGDRAENQDRVTAISSDRCALIAVADGMGGHAKGAAASEATIACLKQTFSELGAPILDPQGFLISVLELAHERVVELGAAISVEHRPRATCAICLVQDGNAYCAHVGDSRIYHVRGSSIVSRTRDHSHVEMLLQEGFIEESDMKTHPMRNYVECCLGGDPQIPDMSIAAPVAVQTGDVLIVCSDGLWTGVDDAELLRLADLTTALEVTLKTIAKLAVGNNSPHSDNTSAAALRLNGATT